MVKRMNSFIHHVKNQSIAVNVNRIVLDGSKLKMMIK